MKPKVLVDPHGYAQPKDLARLGQVVEVVEPTERLSEQAFIEALAGCEGVIRLGGRLPELTRAVFAGSPDLRIAGVSGDRFGTGIDLAAARERGVLAVDTDNIASAAPVAEWDLALMLLCLRNGAGVYRQMMAGEEQWGRAGNDDFVHGELTGKKVGLVGCGHVGQRLVELLSPFRVDLRVADPYLSEEVAAELGIVRGSLDEVLQHADILVVQVPHTPKTEKMIGARELDLLGRGRILINCCRGPVVDYEELTQRLIRGELIAGTRCLRPRAAAQRQPLAPPAERFCQPPCSLVCARDIWPLFLDNGR